MYKGREDQIDWDRVPPDLEDFPFDVQKAILSYSKFQDKYEPDMGYLGKDFTLFDQVARIENINDEGLYLETLLQIDALYIEKSRKDMEAARKKAKHGKK